MVGKLLARGMIAGVVAGLLTFGFARIAGEPQVDQAISFEESHHAADATPDLPGASIAGVSGDARGNGGGSDRHGHTHQDRHGEVHPLALGAWAPPTPTSTPAPDREQGHSHDEPELVSRATQAGLGLFTGVVVFGAAVGGLFALVFAYAYGRTGALGARALSAWLAFGAFIALVIVPNIQYPANPPSVGAPETIGYRTALFFLMIAISIAAMVFSVKVRRYAVARLGAWNGSALAIVLFVAIIAAVQTGLPVINEVPAAFPAALLWKFRVAAIGMQLIMWTTIGYLFGALAERVKSAR
jgi:hypothetical protein